MTLAERIDTILAIDHSARAIEYEGLWQSWGEIAGAMTNLAETLDGIDRVGILMRNHAAVVPSILEAIRSERRIVVLNPMLPEDRLASDIEKTGISVVIGMSEDLDRAVAGGICPIRRQPVFFDEVGSTSINPQANPGHLETCILKQVKGRGKNGSVAIEMLTSGTTGPPKRIPLSRRALEVAVLGAAHFEKGRAEDDTPRLRNGVQLVMAPFSHIGGLFALLNAIAAGRRFVLLPKFTVDGFCAAVKRHGIKVASTPPAALKMLFDANIAREDLASIRAFRVGTAPLDPMLAEAIYERYQIPVLQNYGATEFGGGVAGWTLDDFQAHWPGKRGAVGRLNPGVEGRIVDGVLELRSRQIGDGVSWLRTTDLAKIDDDGFLFILGRADNVIIRGGFKIQPDDIVRAIEAHPSVQEAAVTALPDERLGSVPAAAYLVRSGKTAPPDEEMIAFLKQRLTGYQLPVTLRAVEALPRTVSMKVDQSALRSLLIQNMS